MRRQGVCLALAVCLVAQPAWAGLDVTRWEFARAISDGPPGWTVLELDGPVLAAARPDLADLRVMDASKREIPWREVVPVTRVSERLPVRVFDLFIDRAAGRTTFVADLGAAGRVTNRINLETSSRDFFKKVTFEASDDLETWRPLAGEDYVYELGSRGGGWRLEAAYPAISSRYLRVTIFDLGTPPLADVGAELRFYREASPEVRPVSAEVVAQGTEGNDTWFLLDLVYPGITVTGLELAAGAAGFHRPVMLEGGADGVTWTPVARGAIYRYEGRERMTLDVPGTTHRFYRLTVLSGDDSPLTPERMTLLASPRRVEFNRPGGEELYLLYGNPGADPPRYDPAPFATARDAVPADLGRQLTVLTAPGVAAPPRVAEPSDADPKLWRFERRLIIPWAGFTLVTLDPRVLDGARPDLADLRLVDVVGAVVPFQIRTDRGVPATAWPYAVVNRKEERDSTWWVLDLGARNLPSQFLFFVATGRNFTRPVSVEGSNDGQAWRPVARGTVHRVDTIFGLEENLTLAYPETRCRYLKITVPEAGGRLEPAAVRGWPPSLLFLAEPGQEYRLFYGNPAARARSYPALAFLDAAGPARLGPDALGEEIDHRPPPRRPGFLRPGEEAPYLRHPAGPAVTALLWGLLTLLVAGMGVAVVRVFGALIAGERRRDRGAAGE